MSVMERRLQLLLDQHRYDLVEREAQRSGRSVAAVIREAIDLRFSSDVSTRMSAAATLLVETLEPDGVEPDWSQTKASLESDRVPG